MNFILNWFDHMTTKRMRRSLMDMGLYGTRLRVGLMILFCMAGLIGLFVLTTPSASVQPTQPRVVPWETNSDLEQEELVAETEMYGKHHMMLDTQKFITSVTQSSVVGDVKEDVSMIVVITPRELLIGCHSFHEYLSPEFYTLFVFDEDSVNLFHLNALIKNTTPEQSLGAYLFITEEHHGEIFARKVAFEFVKNLRLEKSVDVEFIYSVNCDMHPLPLGHAERVEFPEQTLKLYRDFTAEKRLRSKGTGETMIHNMFDEGVDDRRKQPFFAMGPLHVEDIRNMKNLRGAILHGKDVGWWHRDFDRVKPEALGDTPWMVDMMRWAEGHALMIDVEVLDLIKEKYFVIPNILAEMIALPRILAQFNVTVGRHNEVKMIFDLAKEQTDLTRPIYSDYDLDWLRLRNFEMMSFGRHPKQVHMVFHTLERHAGILLPTTWGSGFAAMHFRQHWLPQNIFDRPISDNVAGRILNCMMMLSGYYENQGATPNDHRRFSIPAVFPTTFLVTPEKGDLLFLDLSEGEKHLTLFSNDWGKGNWNTSKKTIRSLAEEDRFYDLPLDATLNYIRPPIDTTFIQYKSPRKPQELYNPIDFAT